MVIRQPEADVNMHTEHAQVKIKNEQVEVQIDQYKPFAEAGLKNFADLTKEYVNIGKSTAAQGIARIVRQGNQMADIHKTPNAIPIQAVENAFEMFNKQFSYGAIPQSMPEIDFKGGKAHIEVNEGKVTFDVKPNKPTLNYTRGKVETYLRQKNSIDIQYTGSNLEEKI